MKSDTTGKNVSLPERRLGKRLPNEDHDSRISPWRQTGTCEAKALRIRDPFLRGKDGGRCGRPARAPGEVAEGSAVDELCRRPGTVLEEVRQTDPAVLRGEATPEVVGLALETLFEGHPRAFEDRFLEDLVDFSG